jgi:SAM-dependent methyltransferase
VTAAAEGRGRPRSRWSDSGSVGGPVYDERFERLAAAGQDVHGEASLVDSLGVRSVLDAGCGTGRVAIELDRRGLEVVGVDLDPTMLATARQKGPGITWVQDDLAEVDLARSFDAVVMAGNVMIFVDPGTEGPVLANMARHVADGGLVVAGFSLLPGHLDLPTYDRLAAAGGLVLADRFSTWDRLPFGAGSDYAVSLHRREGVRDDPEV